ncbi:hypothetical protein Pelo_17028 [Pelomyxa schiedti]|nr:hypothetical protein Pelo_17028 [Pelomyxa schiedti]
MEIWDCNVPSHPLRVIECNIKDTCEQILFGHAGFLFHLTGDRVVVSDWESGTKLAILTYKGKDKKRKAKSTPHQHASTTSTTTTTTTVSSFPALPAAPSSPTTEATTSNALPLVGRIVALRGASAQFLALCMLTHPRCGRFGTRTGYNNQRDVTDQQQPGPTEVEAQITPPSSLGVGIRFVWEWVLNEGPVRWFNVSVARQHLVRGKLDEEWEVLFTVGVSEAIMGVVPRRARSLVRDTHGGCTRIVGANATRLVEWVREKPSKKGLQHTWNNDGMIHCVNHKWLVARELEGLFPAPKEKVTIINLMGQQKPVTIVNLQQQLPASAKVIPCMRGMHVLEMFMDEYRCDEALFIVSTGDSNVVQAYVVDVAELWSSVDTFSPISSTCCLNTSYPGFPPDSLRKWLVLHTESNKRAFIVTAPYWNCHAYVLQYAESPDDPATSLHNREAPVHSAHYVCPRLELSQLSDRLYCVSACNQFISGIPTCEIWDCNVPSHPLRFVECNTKDTCEQILFGHAGFLFHLTGDRVVVSDWESGTKLAILTYKGEDKKRFKKMSHTRLSFLL